MRIMITPHQLDAAALLAEFQAANPYAGAIASFIGQVRPEPEIEALELEIYDGFTQAQVREGLSPIAAMVDDFFAAHRYGRLSPGETIVLVMAASRHRRAAFDAVDRAMDWLKTEAAFWKKECSVDGVRWIEPRSEDYSDAQRWARALPPQRP